MTWDTFVLFCFLWLFDKFPSRARIVPRADDPETPMLMQVALVRGRLYLQRFIAPESRDFFHNHRWRYMRSLVLSGSYVEERPGGKLIRRRAGRSHSMDSTTIHRVLWWSPCCVTLFYMSKRHAPTWGYFEAKPLRFAQFTDWREFVKRRIPSLESGNKEMTK